MLIKEVLLETKNKIIQDRRSFLRITYIPIIVFLITEIHLDYSSNEYLVFLSGLLETITYIVFAIGIHRQMLLGAKSNSTLGNIRFKGRELRYFGYLLLISLICGLVAIVGFIPVIGPYLAILGYTYVAARFSLVLPAIAVGKKLGLHDSKELTSKSHWECFVLLGVFPLITILPLYFLTDELISRIIASIYSTLIMIINVGVLSVAYKILTEDYAKFDAEIEG